MGTLRIKGSAKQDFEIDRFIIHIRIKANDKSSGEAIVLGKKRTERFLHIMKDHLGIEPSEFVAEDYSVSQNYGTQIDYIFSRSFSLCVAANLALVEEMTMLLEGLSDVEYEIEFGLSDEQDKSQEVLFAAIADSGNKAEMIAQSLGLRIVGAGNVDFDYNENEYPNLRSFANCNAVDSPSLASDLKNPTRTISRSITIEWETEQG